MEIVKNTDIEFNRIKVRDICQVKTGKRDANEQSEEGAYTFFTCGKQNSKANFFDFDCESILIAGNGNSLGFTQYYNGKFTAYQRTYVLKDFGEYNAKFLYYYLKFFFLNRIKRNIQGAAVNYIRINDILDFEVDYPVHENDVEKIASLLSERESYLQSIQTLISKMEQRNQYYLSGLTSGNLVLSNGDVVSNDEEFKHITLNGKTSSIPVSFNEFKISEITKEENKSKLAVKDAIEGEYPFFNCSENLSMTHNDYLVDGNYIIMSTGGKPSIHYYEGKMAYSSDSYVITTTDNVDSRYLAFLLKANIDRIDRCFLGSGLKHLNKKIFKKEVYHLPKISKQKEISDFLSKNEKEVELVKELYSKEKQVFQWLCEKLVSGEYKLV